MSSIDDIDKYRYCGKIGYFISVGQFWSREVISDSNIWNVKTVIFWFKNGVIFYHRGLHRGLRGFCGRKYFFRSCQGSIWSFSMVNHAIFTKSDIFRLTFLYKRDESADLNHWYVNLIPRTKAWVIERSKGHFSCFFLYFLPVSLTLIY